MDTENIDDYQDATDEELAQISKLREEVRTSVYAAFADTVYPGDEEILKHTDFEGHEEVFVGKDWRHISVDEISAANQVVIMLNRTTFQYMLPAVILGCLHDDTGMMEYNSHMLIPPWCNGSFLSWDSFNNRFDGLSSAQYKCISSYIVFWHANHDSLRGADYECVQKFWDNPNFDNEDSPQHRGKARGTECCKQRD